MKIDPFCKINRIRKSGFFKLKYNKFQMEWQVKAILCKILLMIFAFEFIIFLYKPFGKAFMGCVIDERKEGE